MNKFSKQKLGLIIVLTCGTLWGLSGVLGQLLFRQSTISPGCLSSFRMFVSGICILILCLIRTPHALGTVWKHKGDIFSLFIFAIFGVMAVQYTYFAAISASNAATATVLQYTYPVLMLFYTAFSTRKLPAVNEIIAILFACFGIFLISTHGDLHSLSISKSALFLGLLSAVSFVFYTVYPHKLYEKYGITPIMGWAFVIAGIVLCLITRSYHVSFTFSFRSVALVLAITFFGTLIPFLSYGTGVQILGNVKASLFVTIEPIVSGILTVLFTKQTFSPVDIAGFICIIGAIELVAFKTLRKKN